MGTILRLNFTQTFVIIAAMEKFSKRQLERLAFAEIEAIKSAIQRIEQSGGYADRIKYDRVEELFTKICDTTIKEILEFAPSLRKIETSRLEKSIRNSLKNFDYRLGMRFFGYSAKSIFKELTPINFIENNKQAMCVQILTRTLNCLLDIGISQENIGRIDCCDIDYVFITHEHLDHCSGLEFFPQDTKTIFVASKATREVIFEEIPVAKNLKWKTFKPGESFKVRDIQVSTIPLLHDCTENVAYKLNDGILQSAYLVDFGKWSKRELEFCNDADRIIIESYYDEDKPIKESTLELRRRSSHGHLSIQAANEFIQKLTPKIDREIHFCHS